MQRASTFFNEKQQAAIEAAVGEAESKTSAEIVPVLTTASGRYDRAEDIIGLWVGLILMACTWGAFRLLGVGEASDWDLSFGGLELPLLIVATVVGFMIGAAIGSVVAPLRSLFTPKQEMRDEVAAKARQVFFDNSVHHTEGGTGLLVYISLFERTAAILGDESILEKIGQEALDELCAQLIEGIRAGNPAEALCDVLVAAGERLGEVLPRAEDDVNELSDRLVILD